MSTSLSYLEISRGALRANIAQVRALLPSGNRLIAVVKANAYGHGLAEVISCVEDMVDGFQVDDAEECAGARDCTAKPIYVFGYVGDAEVSSVVERTGILGVYSVERLQLLNRLGQERSVVIPVHLKIDALLGRQGVLPNHIGLIIDVARTLTHVRIESLYSHFSTIEDIDSLEHAQAQTDVLRAVQEHLHLGGFENIPYHISATSGLLTDQQHNWGGSLVRLGVGMYGAWPSDSLRNRYSAHIHLTPAMRWVSHVAQVKELPASYPVGYGMTYRTSVPTRVAVIPQGYSDGFDRGLSNKGQVLIREIRCPVIGRVAMNMFVVNVNALPDVSVEDEVVLLGEQGRACITAEEIAAQLDTINYEIVARAAPLLKRRVVA